MKINTFYIALIFLLISCKDKKSDNENKNIKQNVEIVEKKTEYYNQNPNLKFEQIEKSEIGKINNPDGYSNLRAEPNSKSKILIKIKEDEYFFYNLNNNSNWLTVKDLNGHIGFLNKNKILKVTNKNLYKFSFTDYSKIKTEYRKDTIIDFEDLEKVFENYWEGELIYQSIPLLKKTDNSISFHGKNIQVKFIKEKFNSKINKISRKEKYINNKEFWGTDGDIPRFQLSSIKIIENGISYLIPNSQVNDLFEPTLDKDYIKIFENINNGIIIEMSNSDGAGAYVVVLFLENMKVKKRIIYRPF